MPKWVCDDQRTGIWLKERIGCLTASRMVDVLDFTAKGAEGAKRKKYKMQLVAERLTNMAEEFFVTTAMQRGIDLEEVARSRFEEVKGVFVQTCGFALHDTIEFCGASPDGLLGHDGLIEIKCPNTTTHLETRLLKEIPPQYLPQMLLQLAVTKRDHCWFVSFDDRVPAPADIFIKKFEPTAEDIQYIETAAINFLQEVDDLFDKVVCED